MAHFILRGPAVFFCDRETAACPAIGGGEMGLQWWIERTEVQGEQERYSRFMRNCEIRFSRIECTMSFLISFQATRLTWVTEEYNILLKVISVVEYKLQCLPGSSGCLRNALQCNALMVIQNNIFPPYFTFLSERINSSHPEGLGSITELDIWIWAGLVLICSFPIRWPNVDFFFLFESGHSFVLAWDVRKLFSFI